MHRQNFSVVLITKSCQHGIDENIEVFSVETIVRTNFSYASQFVADFNSWQLYTFERSNFHIAQLNIAFFNYIKIISLQHHLKNAKTIGFINSPINVKVVYFIIIIIFSDKEL